MQLVKYIMIKIRFSFYTLGEARLAIMIMQLLDNVIYSGSSKKKRVIIELFKSRFYK